MTEYLEQEEMVIMTPRHHYKVKRADVKGQDGFTIETWADTEEEGEASIQRKYDFIKRLTQPTE